MRVSFSILLFVTIFQLSGQKAYKSMMDDHSINFYTVVDSAEAYFSNHQKGKGSGWKGYQRWKYLNEYKYYPSGDRSQIDPFFTEKAFENFKNNNITPKSIHGNGWRDLGPYTIDSITGHYSAGLGRIEDFYVNPLNTSTIYLGSRSGGFWRTIDEGVNWENTTDFLVATGVDAIAVSPTNPDSILINVRNSRNGSSHGIYRSIDGGLNWTLTNFNPSNLGWGGLGSNAKIYKIAYHPTNANQVFIGTSEGIFKSNDNLQTWTQTIPTGDITDIDFHPTDPNIIYIYDTDYWGVNQDVVLYSTNNGNSYSSSSVLTGNNTANGYISVSPNCPSCVYFASNNGIWKSINNGLNFNFINNPTNGCDGFAVNDLDTSKMIYGYLDIEGSLDGGQTFNQISYWSQGSYANFNNGQYVHADLRDAECINGVYYVATDGFLCKTTNDGVSWTILSQGTGIRENYSLGLSQSNHFRSIVGSQDNGTSIKHETTWLEFYGADGMEGIIHPLNDDWMIGSIQYGARRRTKDGGITQDGVTPPGQSGSWVAPLIYDPNDHMTVYSFGENIFKSSNFGNSWVNVGTPSFSGGIAEAAIAQNNSDIIIVSKNSNIEKSIDGGLSFSSIDNNLPNFTITDIAIAPHNDQIIFVTFANYENNGQKVYQSNNGGLSWINITFNLGNMPARKIVIDHTNDHNLYLGTEIGVFTKPLIGNTWSLYNNDLPNMTIEDLEIMWGSNSIKAATWGRGLWEYQLVNRGSFPSIVKTAITDTPTDEFPQAFVDQYVTSIISYDQSITSAYIKYSVNNLNFNQTITMSNIADSTWTSDAPIPGVAANNKVYFKVFAVGNNGDTTETYKFMYTTRPSCISSGNMTWETAITLVDFGTINNITGKVAPFNDYTNTDSTKVYLGENYDLDVNLNTDGNYTVHAFAWIDWNQNSVFTDPGEAYDLGTSYGTSNGQTTNSPYLITIPTNAQTGTTIMRVSAKYGVDPQPCEVDFDGEVEEYKIVVSAPNLEISSTNITTCLNEFTDISYVGTFVDSVEWTVTNGGSTYSYSSFNPNVVFTDTGMFNLNLTGYLNGQNYNLDSLNMFQIFATDSTFLDTTICYGESFNFGSQILSNTGLYSETYTTSTCDSIVFLNLTVDSIITEVIQQNEVLIASNATNYSYQWIDCNTNLAIPNESNSTFTAITNGTYAVEISNSNCTDTSDCFEIVGLGLNDPDSFYSVIYPNPSQDNINIKFNRTYDNIQLILIDMSGKTLLNANYLSTNFINVDMSDFSSGVYFITIDIGGINKTVELIKL